MRGTVTELQKEVQEKYRASLLGGDSHVETLEGKADKIGSKVVGMACDVSSSEHVQALAEMALAELGSIDIWVSSLSFLLCIGENHVWIAFLSKIVELLLSDGVLLPETELHVRLL